MTLLSNFEQFTKVWETLPYAFKKNRVTLLLVVTPGQYFKEDFKKKRLNVN